MKQALLSFYYLYLSGYGEDNKGYRCFDSVTQKLYVSRHVVFLEHILFFTIPSTTHNLTKPRFICINLFSEKSDVSSLSRTNNFVGIDTFLFGTLQDSL